MSNTQKPEALRLVDKYEIEGFLGDHRFAQELWCRQAAAELRRLHPLVAELEAQLEAIGAGGVEPLRTLHASQAQDAARLLYATKDYDGFVHLERDKYDYILECMEEAGRSEPTIEDELSGVRRFIDAAISAETKQGEEQP